MNEDQRLILELATENARLNLFMDLLERKANKQDESGYNYMDISDVMDLLKTYRYGKDLQVIQFDNCEDIAYATNRAKTVEDI